MTGVLSRLFSQKAARDQAEPWVRVPQVNVLPRRRAASRKGLARLGLVAAIVLIGAFLALQWTQGSDDRTRTEAVRKELQQVQVQVATGQQAVEELQAKVDAARAEVESAQASYQQLTSGKTNLYAGLNALLGSQVEGIRFDTVTVTPDGLVSLHGGADSVDAMGKFQARLRTISKEIKLLNIGFESTGVALKFSASFQVSK